MPATPSTGSPIMAAIRPAPIRSIVSSSSAMQVLVQSGTRSG